MLSFRDLVKFTKQFVVGTLVTLSLGGASTQLSEAAPTYTTSVTVVGDTLFNVTKNGASPTDSLSWSDSIGSGSSVVNSGLGVIRAHAMTQLTLSSNPDSTLSVYGQANSRFQDSFVVSAQKGDGAEVLSGFLTANVHVNAESTLSSVLGGDSLFSSILWNFSVGSESRNGRSLASLPFGNSSSVSGGDFELLIPWSAGVPVAINFQAAAEAQVTANTAGIRTAIADFDNSMAWGGITSVSDTSGTPVAEFTALNDQGDSYIEAAIIPEPTILALAGLGLSLIAMRRRR